MRFSKRKDSRNYIKLGSLYMIFMLVLFSQLTCPKVGLVSMRIFKILYYHRNKIRECA